MKELLLFTVGIFLFLLLLLLIIFVASFIIVTIKAILGGEWEW